MRIHLPVMGEEPESRINAREPEYLRLLIADLIGIGWFPARQLYRRLGTPWTDPRDLSGSMKIRLNACGLTVGRLGTRTGHRRRRKRGKNRTLKLRLEWKK